MNNNSKIQAYSNRKPWADICRVASVFGVIVIHACGASIYKFGVISLNDWLTINLLDSFARCSVPLFVMLSGALLLSHDDLPAAPIKILARIAKIAVPLLSWNVAYLAYISYFTGLSIDWFSMLKEPPMYHLWFVYMIIGLYLMLPVYQVLMLQFAKRVDLQYYLLILWFVINCVPIYYPLPVLGLLQQTSILGYAGYFLMGSFIANVCKLGGKVVVWLLVYLTAVIITALLTWQFSTNSQSIDERAYLYFSPNVFIASLASFIVFIRLKVGRRVGMIIGWISDRSFLIFFMHVVILERVQNQIAILETSMNVAIQTILVSVLTFMSCLGLASLIRLLPKSREVVG